MSKKLVAYITSEIRDKHGQLKHFEKKEANSLVKNFLSALYVQMSQTTLNSCIDTGGSSRNVSANANSFHMVVGAGSDVFGIVVGTGTGAVAVTDTKLGTQIANGSGAGQLAYLQDAFTTPATIGSTHSFTVSRGFTNNSGGQINVTEVGMYAIIFAGANYYFCIDRTLMSFSIANGATGTVTYTIQVSV